MPPTRRTKKSLSEAEAEHTASQPKATFLSLPNETLFRIAQLAQLQDAALRVDCGAFLSEWPGNGYEIASTLKKFSYRKHGYSLMALHSTSKRLRELTSSLLYKRLSCKQMSKAQVADAFLEAHASSFEVAVFDQEIDESGALSVGSFSPEADQQDHVGYFITQLVRFPALRRLEFTDRVSPSTLISYFPTPPTLTRTLMQRLFATSQACLARQVTYLHTHATFSLHQLLPLLPSLETVSIVDDGAMSLSKCGIALSQLPRLSSLAYYTENPASFLRGWSKLKWASTGVKFLELKASALDAEFWQEIATFSSGLTTLRLSIPNLCLANTPLPPFPSLTSIKLASYDTSTANVLLQFVGSPLRNVDLVFTHLAQQRTLSDKYSLPFHTSLNLLRSTLRHLTITFQSQPCSPAQPDFCPGLQDDLQLDHFQVLDRNKLVLRAGAYLNHQSDRSSNSNKARALRNLLGDLAREIDRSEAAEDTKALDELSWLMAGPAVKIEMDRI